MAISLAAHALTELMVAQLIEVIVGIFVSLTEAGRGSDVVAGREQ